ncbi:BQ5605_C023g09597 [Microbotryum silenes-dioicae]|uniref:BQ5605_C023g09597 protein n=1 Tax=Microbotryum silenes-dioicae TaxID=796604 RepID=A0A2X0NDS0_9BASI|nr:BQ5605_C023g09597 [Microbotryum silenes-dioicae]
MHHAICKTQLDLSQLQLNVVLAYVDASLERSRSDTCSVTAPPRSPTRYSTDQCKHHCRPVTISSATPTLFTRVVNSKSLIDAASLGVVGTSVARLGEYLTDVHPHFDRPNRQTFEARSPPARAHLITTTCEVTICSPLATATSTASTINLPPHSCSIAMDSLSSTDLTYSS